MEGDDLEGVAGGVGERVARLALLAPERAALVPPRADGVEAEHEEAVGAVERLGRLPDPLELLPRASEAAGNV